MKNILEVIKFNEEFPEQPGTERRSLECHCGNAFVTEIVNGERKVVFGQDCQHEPKGMVTLYKTQPEGYKCNDKLFNLLQALRIHQRVFFKSPPGSTVRQNALTESRLHEKELDKFLKERNESNRPGQPDLFTV